MILKPKLYYKNYLETKMSKKQRYTQSDFNSDYQYRLYLRTSGYCHINPESYYEQLGLMLKTEKYIDGSVFPELIYLQGINEKAGYTWKNKGLPEPNIILKDENTGMHTYIYVFIPGDIEDYTPILTENAKLAAHYLWVKCDYQEEEYYVDYFADKIFSHFKQQLNAASYSKNLENPNHPDWKAIFKNVPMYKVKDLIKLL